MSVSEPLEIELLDPGELYDPGEWLHEQERMEESAAEWAFEIWSIGREVDELETLARRLWPRVVAYPQGRDRLPENALLRRLRFLLTADADGLPRELKRRLYALWLLVEQLEESAARSEFEWRLRHVLQRAFWQRALWQRQTGDREGSRRLSARLSRTVDPRQPKLHDPARCPFSPRAPSAASLRPQGRAAALAA